MFGIHRRCHFSKVDCSEEVGDVKVSLERRSEMEKPLFVCPGISVPENTEYRHGWNGSNVTLQHSD